MRRNRSAAHALAGCLALLAACKGEPAERSAPAASTAPAPAAPPPAPAAPADPLTWIHDDYPAALAKAKAAGLPIFVDLWAAWCHTCIAMQETVLRDPAMAPLSGRFVWLAIDTEKPGVGPLLDRLPVDVWPTFYVVSSIDESIQARHLGAGSVAQIRELLTAGERGHLAAMQQGGGLPEGSALWHVREGDRAAAAGQHAKADEHYGKALALSPPDWPRAPDVLVRQLGARNKAGDKLGCARLGGEALERTRPGLTASAADFASIAAGCAEALPAAEASALRQRLVAHLTSLVDAPDAALSADDRSDAMAIARGVLVDLGDAAGARALAERQRAHLLAAHAAAKSAWEKSTFNWHLVEVHGFLGKSAEIVPLLEASERDLPTNYDPPYRLGQALADLGRHDEAIAAFQRSLALAEGPRRANLFTLLATSHHARGDHDAERAALAQKVAVYAALSPAQKRPKAEADAKAALAAFDADHAKATR